ncbi:MAG TPA: conjugal transfer protein TraF [Elusimicrobiota bacterium]|jgi:hypothetical protein|nr:conjugal transfer protein TraF [Elusimicrobiota bacterium]
MKKTIAALFAFTLAAAAPLGAGAEEWTTMGPRAMGMGGAGVALSQGPLSSYWNPGALGRNSMDSYGGTIPVSIHAGITGSAIAGANDLKNATNSCSGAGCQAQANTALKELSNPSNGLRIDGSAGGNFKVGKIAVFANDFIDAGAVTRVDNTNTSLAAIEAGNNKSALIVKGAEILELGAGYGHELPIPGLYVGGDVKLMRAEVGYASQQIISANNSGTGTGGSNFVNDLKSNAASSANVGVDAGALWDVNKTFENAWWSPRVGLVGRNLNNPKFTQAASAIADGVTGRYAVNPQARLGLAISPFHWWNLAADLDLTRNLTPVDGVASRQLDLGTEVNIFNRSWINIPIRVGMARNLETGTNMVTAGTGLNFLHLIVNVSGEASPKMVDTQTQGQSKSIPEELGASFSLSLLFGGSDEERGPSKPAIEVTPTPAAAPGTSGSNDLPPSQVDQVRKNAAASQQDMNNEAGKPR